MALSKKIENLVLQVDPKNKLVKVLRNFGDSQKDVVIEELSCDKELFENKRIFEVLDSVLSAYLVDSPITNPTDVFFVLADYFISNDIIVLPVLPPAKQKVALWTELKKTYPHFETLHFATTVLFKNKKRVVYGVSMAQKTVVQDCILIAKKYGLNLKNISYSANAVSSGFLALGTKLKADNFLILDIKEEKSSFIYVTNKKTATFFGLPIGQNVLSGKTLQFLPNYLDSGLAEKEVFGQTHLSAPSEPTFFAGTMDEIEARSFQNVQKNKKEERIATEKFLSTFATHKTMLQKNFSVYLRHINAIKDVFEEYGLPKLEAVVVNLPNEFLPAIENTGLSVPITSMEAEFAEPSLLAQFLDLFGMIYSGKFNSEQNFLN